MTSLAAASERSRASRQSTLLKVVHIITGLNQGGAEAMLEKLILTGRHRNPEIEHVVFTLKEAGTVGRRLTASGIVVRSLNLPSLGLNRLRQLLRELVPQDQGVVVQTWLWHADLLGGIFARLVGNRHVVWSVRNSMPEHASTKLSSRMVARLCARLSCRIPRWIVCNSQAGLRAHLRVGYCAAKCRVIPNGFDVPRFSRDLSGRAAVRRDFGVGPEEILVGMVARADRLKDHHTFITAAARVAAQNAGVRFVLVGDGIPVDRLIKRQLDAESVADRFILRDRREDMPAVMAALDVFCLASKSEGFPNVLGEAMACGTPSVATDVGDVREILGDERLIAPVGDPASLARCLEHVLSLGSEGRRVLGEVQHESIALRYDIGRVWEQYRDLYRSVLLEPAAAPA